MAELSAAQMELRALGGRGVQQAAVAVVVDHSNALVDWVWAGRAQGWEVRMAVAR